MLWICNASSKHVFHKRVTGTDPECIQNLMLYGPENSVIARAHVNSPIPLYMQCVYFHQDTLKGSTMHIKKSNVYSSKVVSICINPLKTKRKLLYLKTQFVPRSKHFSSLL